jgi:hypothetical protein
VAGGSGSGGGGWLEAPGAGRAGWPVDVWRRAGVGTAGVSRATSSGGPGWRRAGQRGPWGLARGVGPRRGRGRPRWLCRSGAEVAWGAEVD